MSRYTISWKEGPSGEAATEGFSEHETLYGVSSWTNPETGRTDRCMEFTEAKWPKAGAEAAALSARWPGTLFTMEELGDGPEEAWRTYCMGGKSYTAAAELSFPEFEPDRLT